MANHVFLVESLTHARANFSQIYLGKRSLGEETACVHKFRPWELIKWSNEPNVAIWFDKERNWGTMELVDLAHWRSSFNNTSLLAELVHIVIIALIKSRLGKFNLLWKHFAQNLLQASYHTFGHFNLFLSQFHNGAHLFYIERSVSPRIVFIINLEQPHIHIQIVCDQSGQGQLKFLSFLNVVRGDGYRDITKLENAFCATFGREDDISSLEVRLAAHDRNSKLNGKFNVVVAHFAGNNVRLFVLDQVLDLAKRFRRK